MNNLIRLIVVNLAFAGFAQAQDADVYKARREALILAPGDHTYNEILFLQRRDVEDEDWNGRREPLGDALNESLGFEEVTQINRLPGSLTGMLQDEKKAVFLGPVVSATSEIPRELKILRDAQARVPGSELVTKDGPVVLSRHIPRTVDEIEQAMAGSGEQ